MARTSAHMDMSKHIAAAMSCHQICEETITYCLEQGGRHAQASHIRLLTDFTRVGHPFGTVAACGHAVCGGVRPPARRRMSTITTAAAANTVAPLMAIAAMGGREPFPPGPAAICLVAVQALSS